MKSLDLLFVGLVALSLIVGCTGSDETTTSEPTETSRSTDTPTATPTPESKGFAPEFTSPSGIEAEEYAVYSAMIQQNPIGYNLGSSFVIREQTVADLDSFERTLEEVHRLPPELVDSYRSRNVASYKLGANLDLEQDYALMPQEEVDKILRRGGAA